MARPTRTRVEPAATAASRSVSTSGELHRFGRVGASRWAITSVAQAIVDGAETVVPGVTGFPLPPWGGFTSHNETESA